MQMMYCFINNIHVDYAELLWEGLHYSLHHPTSSIPYPRFTKIIISHYMTNFPEISRRARDRYHNLKDDDIMKNIFNSGRYKDKVGMKIPAWMISEEMKHTEHYQMYAEVFGIDVPLTQSQPTESTQGMHRTPSAPRSPNPNMDAGVSSALKRSTVIHFRIPQRRSTRLTPPAPVPTVDKADEMILQDTLQVSLAEHKSREEQEARENVELVNEHLASVEIEKMVEGPENVIDDSSIPRNDDQNIPGTRLEPRSDKESSEVEITNDEEVEITNVVIHVNVNEEDEEITDEVYELKQREKGKIVEESRSTPFPHQLDLLGFILISQHNKEETDKMIVKAMIQERRKLQAKISSQIQKAIDTNIPSLVDASVPQTTCRTPAVRPRDQDDPHDDAHPEGENSAKRKKEILASPHPRKTTPLVQSCQRDPEAPALSLINQDLFYQQKVNLTAQTISFLGIEKHKTFSIIYEHVHGIIYKNSKKEKRVMRHSEIHKFCDATLNRVLKGLKSYNNDVKYDYIQRDLTEDEVEYLELFEEEIKVRLKYHNQMRR
ncbi:hypothetical protein Tco_1375471 [Tanacetum coccineum]